jgi:hypothetical protein
VTISFDFLVEELDPKMGAKVTIFALLYGDVTKYYQLVFNLKSNGSQASGALTENTYPGGIFKEHAAVAASKSKWNNVKIIVTIKEPMGTGNPLAIYAGDDGSNLVLTTGVNEVLAAPLIGDNPRMELGIGWMDTTNGTAPWKVLYDNFVVYWDPI